MDEISLLRLVRTPYSEQYMIMLNREGVAQLDIHFEDSNFHATAVFFRSCTNEEIARAMEYVEEHLIQDRENFIVSIFSGQDISESIAEHIASSNR